MNKGIAGPKWEAYGKESGVERRRREGYAVQYRVRITVKDLDGQRVQRTKIIRNPSDAKQARVDLLLEWETKKNEQAKPDARLVTFAELADEYMRDHIVPPKYDDPHSDDRVKDHGIVGVRDGERAMKLFKDAFGPYLLRDIKKHDIKKWITARKETPKQRGGGKRSLASINGELRFLCGALMYAVEAGYIQLNPCRGLIDQKNEHKRTRTLTFDEERRLLEVANPTLASFLVFLLDTAARCGEARQVERRDVNLNNGGVITLRKRTTKAKSQRVIPILTLRLRQVIEDRLASIPNDPHALLFPETYYFYEYWLQVAAREAMIDDVRLHDCRRTWVRRWVESGRPIAEGMKIGGWSTKQDLAMFMRYLNLTEETNQISRDAFTAYMAQAAAAAQSQQVTELMQSAQVN
jgi:integrase